MSPRRGPSRPGPKGGGAKGAPKAAKKGAPPRGGARPGPGRPARPGGRGAGAPPGRARSKERGLGGTQVEGRQAVRELLLAGRRKVYEIVLAADVDRAEILTDIVDLAAELRVPVTEVGRGKLDSLSHTDAPQGIIARAAELPETSLEELCEPQEGRPAFLLAVDGVTDPGNLGALLRIAECAGVTGVVLPKHRAVHVTPTAAKAAAGAIEYLPMALVGGLPTAIEAMKSAGVWTIGLDAGGETSIHDLGQWSDAGVCLVLGAEGRGLSRLVRLRCDLVASIPLHGRLASLNVASAGAVACYEIARRRSEG